MLAVTIIVFVIMAVAFGFACFQMGRKEGFYDGYIEASDYALSLMEDLNSRLRDKDDESN